MPNTAIATGLVDFAIPAQEMMDKIVEFARGLLSSNVATVPAEDEEVMSAYRQINEILRTRIGHDFSGYKNKTFYRRVNRRMQIVKTETVEEYAKYLAQESKEVNALFRDLLINVTSFFRDADAYEALQATVIPSIFEGRGAANSVRVWVPGCATGEEVYSIAMLMREHMDTLPTVPHVQIFATDIDASIVAVARSGQYPEALVEGVSEARRKRFFALEGSTYVVEKEIRELCVFSPHSIVRDPPFSRMDLVSCRNVLIYFGSELQNQTIPTFHYALKPGGYLFLGSSENISRFDYLFAPVDRKQRIFRSRAQASGGVLVPRLTPGIPMAPLPSAVRPLKTAPGSTLRHTAEARVLERFSPAHVVVNQDGDIVYFSSRTGKYLEAGSGAPSRNLLSMARKGLRLELRTLLRASVEKNSACVRDNIAVETDDGSVQILTLVVEPVEVADQEDRLFLIIFADTGPLVSRENAINRPRIADDAIVTLLEHEIRETRDKLQGIVEEYETTLEEVKSTNEEILSVNEEYQSTNEELEASKEELQSLNEELQTVNSELTLKIDALDKANSDLCNLFDSTQIATIFIDQHMLIRSFTPVASKLFNILTSDKGRPLTDLSPRVDYPEMTDHIIKVLATGESIEHKIKSLNSEQYYLARTQPYRSSDGDLKGAVLTFVDISILTKANINITNLKATDAHLRLLVAELNHRVKNMLSVALAIVKQTLAGSPISKEIYNSVVGRLHGLAASHELLVLESWSDMNIVDLLHKHLSPFGLDRIRFPNTPVLLKPREALSLGMVLHELSTNAAKYGSLSSPEGLVTITWFEGPGDGNYRRLNLQWEETGGPPPTAPAKRGFGMSLIQQEVAYTLDGNVDFSFMHGGLRFNLDCNIAQ
ncbi:MAG: CheR family methyltransferase [Hyphomicrobiales bacterium]|nr:CheR family methyltransferase [Hyphomicrobiales bacterium]